MPKYSYQLFHYVLRLNKENTAFFYFQLEASDGLCFYSTLDHPLHAQYRDVDLKGDILLKNEIQQIISECQKRFSIDILIDETISDKKGHI